MSQMTREALVEQLVSEHDAIASLMEALSPAVFTFSPGPGKWTAPQHAKHILKSIQPMNLGLMLPSAVPKVLFGPPRHEPMDFDRVVKKYQQNLANGLKAPFPFVPASVRFSSKNALAAQLRKTIRQLVNRLSKYSDVQLDSICFPHPSLGKISLRELLYFTLYHARHHKASIEKILTEAC
jgi:hypothetical protein